jgi:hypothetical protein
MASQTATFPQSGNMNITIFQEFCGFGGYFKN